MMRAPLGGMVVATTASDVRASEWRTQPNVSRVVALKGPSPSGRRLGKLAFGLGLDALAVACKTRMLVGSQTVVLTTNPWIAVALRLLGHRKLTSLGIYATPGTRTWKIFRRVIPDCAMVVMSQLERDNWRDEGGTAAYVRYGNSFPYPPLDEARPHSNSVRIFIGGSSDRDLALVDHVAKDVLDSGADIELAVAVGGAPSIQTSGSSTVRRLAPLTQAEFGEQLKRADLSFLPLVENGRSAGHMFIVGSLQVGTPVVYTETEGMRDYEDPIFCRAMPAGSRPLPFMLGVLKDLPSKVETRDFWRENFSREKFLTSVVHSAQEMISTTMANG